MFTFLVDLHSIYYLHIDRLIDLILVRAWCRVYVPQSIQSIMREFRSIDRSIDSNSNSNSNSNSFEAAILPQTHTYDTHDTHEARTDGRDMCREKLFNWSLTTFDFHCIEDFDSVIGVRVRVSPIRVAATRFTTLSKTLNDVFQFQNDLAFNNVGYHAQSMGRCPYAMYGTFYLQLLSTRTMYRVWLSFPLHNFYCLQLVI